MGDSSSLREAFLNDMQGLGKKFRSCEMLSKCIHLFQIYLQECQVLTNAVVKIASKSTPFLILGLQQTDCESSQRTSSSLDQAFELGVAQPQRRF